MAKGDSVKGKPVEITDERARRKTIKLTTGDARAGHLYTPSFLTAPSQLVYISDRSGHQNFYSLGLDDFKSTQLTDSATIYAAGGCCCDATREIFFWRETALVALDVDSLEERVVLDDGYQGGRLAVSADGRFVAFGAASENVPGFGGEFTGRFVLMLVSARGEGAHPVLTAPFVIGRVEFSPRDADTIAYTWAGRWDGIPQRMWVTDATGLEGGPLGSQNPNEIRGGAFFSADGWTLGYHGSRYHIRSTEDGYFVEETAWLVGTMNANGSGDFQYYCPGPTGRCRISSDGTKFISDVGGAFVPEHQSVALINLDDERGVFEPLFFTGAAATRATLPRPQFSPDDSKVVFTIGDDDASDVYLVSL